MREKITLLPIFNQCFQYSGPSFHIKWFNLIKLKALLIQLYIFKDFVDGDFVNSTSFHSINTSIAEKWGRNIWTKGCGHQKKRNRGAEVIDASNTVPTMSTSGLTLAQSQCLPLASYSVTKVEIMLDFRNMIACKNKSFAVPYNKSRTLWLLKDIFVCFFLKLPHSIS